MTYEPSSRSIAQLLADWGAIMRDLRLRDVIRTNNNPVGDIAEAIVAAYVNGRIITFTQAAPSQSLGSSRRDGRWRPWREVRSAHGPPGEPEAR